MSNLKSIVPPLDLCEKIPAGEFEDSALVWCRVRGKNVVCQREHWVGVFGMSPVPTPTLEEVLEEIGKVESWDTATITRPIGANTRIVDTALKRWFKVKGIEVKE
ncbi:hypothetical protein [uncultured Victivallis sp.]|uniref:hypothetical protein n=1 Tax=uncultured Victivallis sp. TaxID=354118 RepID=UPI0025E50895|nr:hypothetical protein [uncultured Victivallis sp.]